MASATLTSKGQLTIPKQIRERLGLHTGDKVDFRIEEDGSARMRPISNKVSDVYGILASFKKKRPVSVKQMDQAVKKALRKGAR